MPPKTTKGAIKDALENLTEKNLQKFRSALLDRRGEHKVKTSAVEGKDFLVIGDVLVSTFTESGALKVTLELLRQIGCNDEAEELASDTSGLSSTSCSVSDTSGLSSAPWSGASAFPKNEQNQRKDDEDNYRVTEESMKKRLALLITNRDFTNKEKTRRGAEKDEENMDKLLTYLGYKVVKYRNLTGQEIDEAVRTFSQDPGLYQTDSVFVVLMSHGKLGAVLGAGWPENSADEFLTDNIYKHLNSANCRALLDKPKVIIIQACRGEKDGSVLISDGASVIDLHSDAGLQPSQSLPADTEDFEDDAARVHKEKDFIALLSCTPDTVSYRSPESGSLLIQYIVEEFNKFAHRDHIEDLFRRVMKRFENFPHATKRQMPSKDRCTLVNRFFLFPGH